jgi:hypothetical protein
MWGNTLIMNEVKPVLYLYPEDTPPKGYYKTPHTVDFASHGGGRSCKTCGAGMTMRLFKKNVCTNDRCGKIRYVALTSDVSLDALRERSEGVSCCSCYFLGTKDINVEYYESSNTCPAGMYLDEVLVLGHEYKCIHPECFKPITIHDPINGATTSDKRVQNYDTLNAKNNCKLYKEKL